MEFLEQELVFDLHGKQHSFNFHATIYSCVQFNRDWYLLADSVDLYNLFFHGSPDFSMYFR